MEKIHVALVFGGVSAEHEISLLSARNVLDAIDKDRYEIILLAIDKQGRWFTCSGFPVGNPGGALRIDQCTDPVMIGFQGNDRLFVLKEGQWKPLRVDVFFPILHGPYGEDGTIQGLFRILRVPFVGCDVMGSAAGMDKVVMKRLLSEAGIPIGKYLSSRFPEYPLFEEVQQALGLPFYIKPANMGSSVGISRVGSKEQYETAVQEAFAYDHKILFEENIEGMEIECAVLGNRDPRASAVGRVISYHTFYTYESKYLDDKGFQLEIPARIDPESAALVRETAVRVFKALDAEGLGRVDVFLKPDGTVLVNEINTMPGFTSISMYPMLWKESGMSYPELIDKLIDLALEREDERKLLHSDVSRNP